jgi:hypothetical protein
MVIGMGRAGNMAGLSRQLTNREAGGCDILERDIHIKHQKGGQGAVHCSLAHY